MTTSVRHRIPQGLIALLLACVVIVGAAGTARASSGTQVLLSATGISTTAGPAGFWIWSQPGNNNYGSDGHGSLYFYALLKTTLPVEASNVTVSGNTVSETVWSTDGVVYCPAFTATETAPAVGYVSFTCTITTASGTVSASASNVPAQVNISG